MHFFFAYSISKIQCMLISYISLKIIPDHDQFIDCNVLRSRVPDFIANGILFEYYVITSPNGRLRISS